MAEIVEGLDFGTANCGGRCTRFKPAGRAHEAQIITLGGVLGSREDDGESTFRNIVNLVNLVALFRDARHEIVFTVVSLYSPR